MATSKKSVKKTTVKKAPNGTTVSKADSIRRNTINRITGMRQGEMDDYMEKHNKEHAKNDSIFKANYQQDSTGNWKRKTPWIPPKKSGGTINKKK